LAELKNKMQIIIVWLLYHFPQTGQS